MYTGSGGSNENLLWSKVEVTDLKYLRRKKSKHALSTVHINNAISFSSLGRVDIRTQLSSA